MTSQTTPKLPGQVRISSRKALALTVFRSKKKSEQRRAANLAEKAGTASAAELKRVRFLMLVRGLPSHPVCQNEVIRQCTSDYNSMIRFMQALKAMEPETFDLVRVRACSYTCKPPNTLGSFPTNARAGSTAASTLTW